MNIDMEEMIIYKKDTKYLKNGKVCSRQLATFLSGNKKNKKVFVSTFSSDTMSKLIDKKFFAKVAEVNGTNYIVEYLLKN